MLRPSIFNTRKPKKRRSSGMESAFYGVLCVGVVGFFVWRWWVYKPPQGTGPVVGSLPAANASAPTATQSEPTTNVVAPPKSASVESHSAQSVMEAQVALVRCGISPGSIDGALGGQTRAAITAFQTKNGLPPTGVLDAATKTALALSEPALTQYVTTADDFGRLLPVPKTWLEKSEQPRLDYATILELLGEKSFSSPQLIRSLNPSIDWTKAGPGTVVTIPKVEYPPAASKAAMVKISLGDCVLEAFDENSNLMVHFPCSIGRVAEKRPVGELHVQTIALNPNYTFDPAIFPESEEARQLDQKLILPPGPRNPVGVAWIGLDRPGYGIHGTPAPEKVGRTESHGCFRLANWNADYLAKLVWIGMPVEVE